MVAHVTAVANRKGGVGKTTSAVNVAAELSSRGLRVLLIDLDPQGHAGLGIGVRPERGEPTIHHIFRQDGLDANEAIRRSKIEGLDILPADRNFQVHSSANDPLRLIRALESLIECYDEIVIDTSPTVDIATLAALASANHVLVPTQLLPLAYEGVVRFSSILLKVATTLNHRFSGLAIVPIQMDMRMNIQRIVLAKLLAGFGPNRVFRGIRTDVSLAEAFGAQMPVRYYRPNCRGATDYALLTDDVLTFWSGTRHQGPPSCVEQGQSSIRASA
jgi:chromosome partitioning protein